MAAHAISVETVRTSSGARRKIGRCSCGWATPIAKTAHAVDKTARAQHPQAFCRTPDKLRFATSEAAVGALVRFWQTARLGKKELRRAYECECGWWHTTSRPGHDILTYAGASNLA